LAKNSAGVQIGFSRRSFPAQVLVPVLARMEWRGISIERQELARRSGDFARKAASLEDEIKELAGEPLNPGSPKQLDDILFGEMGLPGAHKTTTGAWSTSALVLRRPR
jgi:DNA polymerase I